MNLHNAKICMHMYGMYHLIPSIDQINVNVHLILSMYVCASLIAFSVYVTGSEKRGNIALTIDSELTIPSYTCILSYRMLLEISV